MSADFVAAHEGAVDDQLEAAFGVVFQEFVAENVGAGVGFVAAAHVQDEGVGRDG